MSYFIFPQVYPFYTFLNVATPSCQVNSPSSEMSIITPNSFCPPSNQNGFTFYNENFAYHADSRFLGQEPAYHSNTQMNCESAEPQKMCQTKQRKPGVQSNQVPLANTETSNKISISPVFGNLIKQKIKSKKQKNHEQKTREDVEEYFPQNQKRKIVVNIYQQNQNRNIVPNQINQIISFIQKKNKSGHIIQKLMKKYPHPQEFTSKRFYLYQSLLKNKIGHYTNEKSLKYVTELYEPKCEIYTESQQRYYNKLCRVMIRHFLHQESIFMILTSKRMKSEKKRDHLRAKRSVADQVLKILRGC